MKATRSVIIIFSLLLEAASLTQVSWSQIVSTNNSIGAPTDSRSIALGESFVALPGNVAAMMYNPAGLAGIRGITAGYFRRSNRILDIEGRYAHSFVAAVETPIVDVGVFYTRFNHGELLVRTVENPDGTGEKVNPYDETYGLSLAKGFGEYFNLGVSIKRFNMSGFPTQSSQSGAPIAVDFGLLVKHDYSTEDAPIRHRLTVGASLQNTGGKIEFSPYMIGGRTYTLEPALLPQFLRLGAAYNLIIAPATETSAVPAQVTITTEYRNLLNADDRQNATRDYWGFGMETVLFDVVALRLGGYGNAEITTLRYGAGLIAPLVRLGADVPIIIRLDYSAVPFSTVYYESYRTVMHSFSFSLQYENELF